MCLNDVQALLNGFDDILVDSTTLSGLALCRSFSMDGHDESSFTFVSIHRLLDTLFYLIQMGVNPKIGGFLPPKWMVKIMENQTLLNK